MASFPRSKLVVGLVLAVAAFVAVPAGMAAHLSGSEGVTAAPLPSVALPANPAGEHPLPAPAASATSPMAQRVLAELANAHVPLNRAFLPNFNARTTVAGGSVTPLYSSAPAPMGLGYWGVQDVNGTDTGTVGYTSSVAGQWNLNSIQTMYLDNDGPDQFTVQLNTVLTNVDLLGDTSNQFWIQNVPFYTESTHQLTLIDNIWNFSSSAFYMDPSTIYAHGPGGAVVPGVYYYAVGPTFDLAPPFTVNLYNNASVVNDRPTVFFNYSITASNGTNWAGSFDFAEFNSTGSAIPTGPAPPPTFQINGLAAGNQGYLLNDAEIMLGGPGGGSTTNVVGIDSTMGLWTLPNGTSTFQPVPAAYDFGTDTGETSAGIAEWGSTGASPLAHLGAGPSLLYPLWGLTHAHPGAMTTTVDLTPSNAFAFASPGPSFSAPAAAWAPTDPSGVTTYTLAPGTYTWKFLLSDFNPTVATTSANASMTVGLTRNASLGVYTPLWAWNNGQLAAISVAGTGTIGNPYVLDHSSAPIDPLFGEFSDYEFPVFAGVQLVGTTAYVSAVGMPTFSITYSLPAEQAAVSGLGEPTTNFLQYNFWGVQHVSIGYSTISGWFYSADSGFPLGNVVFWNSTHNLVAGNTFLDMSTALIFYGGGYNTVWGNTFSAATAIAPNPGTILYGGTPLGLWLIESNDLVYNNYFDVTYNAYTPTNDIYNGAPAFYFDHFNVPLQSASNVRSVNGWALSGSILGLSWQGGNYWNDYGAQWAPYGHLPYNGGYLIYPSGDYLPLTANPLYLIVFHETGLAGGTAWSVTFDGITESSTSAYIGFSDFNGTYAYVVGPVSGHTAHPATGAATIAGAHTQVTIKWT